MTSLFASAVCVCALEGAARADLPSNYQPGFALDTLDPAPAGDRFLVAPDASVGEGFTSRLVLDGGYRAFDVRTGNASLTKSSDFLYLHAGIAAAIRNILLLSMDLPFVLNQSVMLDSPANGFPSQPQQTLGSPAPEAGDLGDWRVGARAGIPRQWMRQSVVDFGVAADFWMSTGNPQNLTGGPAPRFRMLALASGGVPLGDDAFEYAVGAGYMFHAVTAASPLPLESIPLRAAIGLKVPVWRFQIRPAVEYAGNVPVSTEVNIHRNTHELLGGFTLRYGKWVLGLHMGTGLSDAPGVPLVRGVVSLGYTGTVTKPTPAGLTSPTGVE